jgi:hypothetical protein
MMPIRRATSASVIVAAARASAAFGLAAFEAFAGAAAWA